MSAVSRRGYAGILGKINKKKNHWPCVKWFLTLWFRHSRLLPGWLWRTTPRPSDLSVSTPHPHPGPHETRPTARGGAGLAPRPCALSAGPASPAHLSWPCVCVCTPMVCALLFLCCMSVFLMAALKIKSVTNA